MNSLDTPQVFVCDCGRNFSKAHGLRVHLRSCRIKTAEREKDKLYEQKLLAEQEQKKKEGVGVGLTKPPRRPRPWEKASLRGKPPLKPHDGAQIASSSQTKSMPAQADPEVDDSIQTQYHPKSGCGVKVETFEAYRERMSKPVLKPVSKIAEPWPRPFQSRADFEFAQLAVEANLTDNHVDRLIRLFERCIQGQDTFSLTSYEDLQKTWDAYLIRQKPQ